MSGENIDLPSETLAIVLEISVLERQLEDAVSYDQRAHALERIVALNTYLAEMEDPYDISQSQPRFFDDQQHIPRELHRNRQDRPSVPQGRRLTAHDQHSMSSGYTLDYANVYATPARIQPASRERPVTTRRNMEDSHKAKKTPTRLVRTPSSHASLSNSHTSDDRNRQPNEDIQHWSTDDHAAETEHGRRCDGCKEVPGDSDSCELLCGHLYCRNCVPMFFETPELRPERCC